jgi:hypothetical protein
MRAAFGAARCIRCGNLRLGANAKGRDLILKHFIPNNILDIIPSNEVLQTGAVAAAGVFRNCGV